MIHRSVILLLLSIFSLAHVAISRNQPGTWNLPEPVPAFTAARPPLEFRVHAIGSLWNSVTNYGAYGDAQTVAPSMEWPGGSNVDYLWFGSLWIGARQGEKTSVSTCSYGFAEWQPSEGSVFDFAPSKSNLDSYVLFDDLAAAPEHTPLGLQVKQRALSWSAPGFDEFIAYEYEIINIGEEVLTDLFVGWYYDCDVGTGVDESSPGQDDLADYDGWHANSFTGWHGLPPNLTTPNGEYIDIVENIDKNLNGVLDGYDEWGVPYGDPYNPRHDPSRIHPDGFPDEWQVYIANNDTILVPRGISIMYDGDDSTTVEEDTGEMGHATGYIGSRLLYSPVAAFHQSPDDTLPRISAHQWWSWNEDRNSDANQYATLIGEYSQISFLPHPFDHESTANDYRFFNSTGPISRLAPGESFHLVSAAGVSQGLMGLRKSLDNALLAYYSGSEHSDPAHPASPVDDYHWEIAGPPVAKDIRALPVYVRPGQESVTISARIYDIDGTVTAAAANIHGADGALVTTIPLVDDGTRGDATANDGTFTAVWPVAGENFFNVSLYTRDNAGNEITREKVAHFTSAGPLKIDQVTIVPDRSESPFIDTDFMLSLTNLGQTLPVGNLIVKVTTSDPMLTASNLPLIFSNENLAPGSVRLVGPKLNLVFSDECPGGQVINFDAEIQSENRLYWRDTFSLTIEDDKPPRLRDVLGARFYQPGETAKIAVRLGEGSGVRLARADIQSPDDVTRASLDLVNTRDDVFEADWIIPAGLEAFDVDLTVGDNFENDLRIENIAGFTSKPFISSNSILVIDNDNYNYPTYGNSKKPYETYYTEVLDSLGMRYDVYSVYFHGPVTTDLLNNYQDGIVIWETGDTRLDDNTHRGKAALEPAEQTALMTYLDQGGRLFLSGQGTSVAGETDSEFFRDYLGVTILTPNMDRRNALPVTGEPIGEGIRPRFVGGTGANNQLQLASLKPLTEQTLPIFLFPNQEAVAVKVMQESRVQIVYFAFGFESVSSNDYRKTLMSRIIESLRSTRVEPRVTSDGLPVTFALHPNFPNPFNPTTRIRFDLPQEAQVNIQILNLLGQPVALLLNQKQPAGSYELKWDASSVASGVYLIQFVAGEFRKQQKMLLLK